MSKNPKNNNVFSTLGVSNHSEGERQRRTITQQTPERLNT